MGDLDSAARTQPTLLRARLPAAFAAVGLALALVVLTAGGTTAHEPAPEAAAAVTTARPGQVVQRGAVSVLAPPRGQGVWGEVHFVDGSFEALELSTDGSGVVSARHTRGAGGSSGNPRTSGDGVGDTALAEGATVTAAPTATAAPRPTPTPNTSAECTTGEYYLYTWRIPTYSWALQTGSIPTYLKNRTNGTAAVLDAIKRANTNIVTGRNVCARADAISASYRYLGSTTRYPNISSSASCTGGNGYSTIGFGALPSGIAGMACAYGIYNGTAREGDVRLATGVKWETTASCYDEYRIEALMTHEFGHIYGLKHVTSSALTMYRGVRKCSMAAATLGLGDLRGLERKY